MTSSSCRGGYSRGVGGVRGVAHLLMSSNRACFMSAIDMVRSDSSAIAICISQATNFPQILTRLSCSLSLSLSLSAVSLPLFCTFVCDFVGLHMFSIDPFSLFPFANAKIHNCPDFRRGRKCNATKTHATQCKQGACCIHIIIVLFSVCFFSHFPNSYSNSVELRTIKDDKGKRRCWDSSKQWQGQLPSVCGERRDAGSGTRPNQVNANGSRTPRPPSCPYITVWPPNAPLYSALCSARGQSDPNGISSGVSWTYYCLNLSHLFTFFAGTRLGRCREGSNYCWMNGCFLEESIVCLEGRKCS